MMDPYSVSELALALAVDVVKIVGVIKQIVEASKSSREALKDLLNRTERMRGFLELVRSLTKQMRDVAQLGATLNFNDGEVRQTLTDLDTLVDTVANKSGDFWRGVWLTTHKKEVEALVAKLDKQEREINTLLLSITT
jgi:ABC-type transporter Mla subunit MlaD